MSFFDRKKDVIIRGGFTISAKEVENIVIEHSKVADAAVVGEPHEDLGERVAVFAVPQSGEELSLEDITEYMGDNVAIYKRPERLEVVEEIPETRSGKSSRRTSETDYGPAIRPADGRSLASTVQHRSDGRQRNVSKPFCGNL